MRALPAANANITAADTEIQMIPGTSGDLRGWRTGSGSGTI